MASATNPLLSSNFFGTTTILHSPPTPKTTSKPKSSLPIPLLFFSQRKLFATKNIFNCKPDSQPFKSATSQATLATLLFSSLTPQHPSHRQHAHSHSATCAPSPAFQTQRRLSFLPKPPPQSQVATDLPEDGQWRYSEFLNAVKKGKVDRVRFVKDGSALQLTAIDGRRASVVVPNDPDLIDILAMNGVDISVSEGDSGGALFNFIGNLLFPILAFAGLFLLFRRAGGGPGGPGGLGGPMDFGRS